MEITLDLAVECDRHFEHLFSDLNTHVALGGGTLHRGRSEKDIDLILYPHKGTDIPCHKTLIARIESDVEIGYIRYASLVYDKRKNNVDKPLFVVWTKKFGRIDMFMMSCHLREHPTLNFDENGKPSYKDGMVPHKR